MDQIRRITVLVAFLAMVMSGCHRQTTVILPPETGPDLPAPATEPTADTTAPPVTIPITEPTTESSTPQESEPVTEPSVTVPAESPTEPPVTEPPTFPATDPPVEYTEPPELPSISDHPIDSTQWEILEELNSSRASGGLAPLTMDRTLCALSTIRAEECAQSLSPTRPDGRAWSTVLADHNCTGWDDMGEIRLYSSQGLPASILVDTWISAEQPKSHILSGDYEYCGIGIFYQGGSMYVVAILTG